MTVLGAERVARMLRRQAGRSTIFSARSSGSSASSSAARASVSCPSPTRSRCTWAKCSSGRCPFPIEQPEAGAQVPAHKRRKPRSDFADETGAVSFFDDKKVPVETIELPAPEAKGLAPEQYEVIGEKTSFRPGAYVVLKYVRPVIKLRETQVLHCAPAPAGVIEGSRADVSFIAGLLLDKFAYHLPL